MTNAQELIKALRCDGDIFSRDCTACPYFFEEKRNDVVYRLVCDGDKIIQDAADMLEELTNDA